MTFLAVLAVMTMTCSTGCSGSADQQISDAKLSAPSELSATFPRIEASVKDRAEIQKLIKSHAGKVVVLDLWALW